jgi:hypothetical protein
MVVILDALEAVTVESDWTAQALAVMPEALVTVTPVPDGLSATMQPGAPDFSSAYEETLIGSVFRDHITRESRSGTLDYTVTWTAWFPSPDGEFTSEAAISLAGMPFSVAILLTAAFIEEVEPVELYTAPAPMATASATR